MCAREREKNRERGECVREIENEREREREGEREIERVREGRFYTSSCWGPAVGFVSKQSVKIFEQLRKEGKTKQQNYSFFSITKVKSCLKCEITIEVDFEVLVIFEKQKVCDQELSQTNNFNTCKCTFSLDFSLEFKFFCA